MSYSNKVIWALVDCNNFYASCEKLFRPDLADRPVVVLSNNDGCIVARSLAKAIRPWRARRWFPPVHSGARFVTRKAWPKPWQPMRPGQGSGYVARG
nr:MAG TPA: hypothetical protein [Caudoviricetes sp.]